MDFETSVSNHQQQDPLSIKFKIGGVSHSLLKSTIRSLPGESIFKTYLSGNWENVTVDGEIIVDRDGTIFEHIKKYLLGYSIHFPSLAEGEYYYLEQDAKYFGLANLVAEMDAYTKKQEEDEKSKLEAEEWEKVDINLRIEIKNIYHKTELIQEFKQFVATFTEFKRIGRNNCYFVASELILDPDLCSDLQLCKALMKMRKFYSSLKQFDSFISAENTAVTLTRAANLVLSKKFGYPSGTEFISEQIVKSVCEPSVDCDLLTGDVTRVAYKDTKVIVSSILSSVAICCLPKYLVLPQNPQQLPRPFYLKAYDIVLDKIYNLKYTAYWLIFRFFM